MQKLLIQTDGLACICGQRPTGRPQHQRGFTLIELMIAMFISTLIALAAISALVVTRQGFTTVDASSQLRDNGRFASDLILRIGVQVGFKDRDSAGRDRLSNDGLPANPDPNIEGRNNQKLPGGTDPLNATVSTWSTGEIGAGSDILVLRYQSAETFPGSGVADKSMIDCSGASNTSVPIDRYDRAVSIFHVALSQGEPSLMCSVWSAASGSFSAAQPIIQGVENFQVLYGTDGVTPNTAPASSAIDTNPDRYLRADQLVVGGDPVGTNANWRRVRSIRIGMVLRGALGSATAAYDDATATTYYPFGAGKSASGGARGSALAASADAGSDFKPPADGRLRQVVTFTVHLRNDQGL